MTEDTIDENTEESPDQAVAETQAVYEATEPADVDEPAEDAAGEEQALGTRLVLKRSGQETDIVFAFSPPATIGRFDPSVGPIDVDLGTIEEGSYVSRKHARITAQDEGFKIVDLGSSNGTYILRDDFEKIEEADLNDGDEVSFGNARFVFRT